MGSGSGVPSCNNSDGARKDVADSSRERRPDPVALERFGSGIGYGLLASSLSMVAALKFTGAPLRLFGHGSEPATRSRPAAANCCPRRAAGGGVRLGGAAGIRAVRGGVPDQVRLRDRAAAPQRTKDRDMTLAASLFFVTPVLENLDVAFQALNIWHSFLYLAVVIYLNRYRQVHGMIGSATVARFAARGWGLYAVGIGLIAACGVLYVVLRGLVLLIAAWPGDVMQQHYVSVLSALLIHYYFDHFFLLRIDGVITPSRKLAAHRAGAP